MLSEVQKKALEYVASTCDRTGSTYAEKSQFGISTYMALWGRGLIDRGVRVHKILWWKFGKRVPELLEQHIHVFRVTPAGRAALEQEQ